MTEASVYEVYTLESQAEEQKESETVVVLKAHDRDGYLPIYITAPQGQTIAVQIRGQKPERPQTYNLMAELIEKSGGKVEAVHIADMRDQIFYAHLLLSANGVKHKIDCRPSDALALAAQVNAPVFVAPWLLMDLPTAEATLSHRVGKSIKPFALN